jgi:hypothetical protein
LHRRQLDRGSNPQGRERPRLSLRKIAARLAEQGFVGNGGRPYAAESVSSMLSG